MTHTTMQQKALSKLVFMALITALTVVIERFLGYNGKVLSISLGFLPIAMAGMLFGVLPCAVVAAASDALGALLFPSGAFNPLFTLVAALTGACYGFFLRDRTCSRQKVILCQAFITVICHLTLHTLILVPIIGKGFFALLPLRLVKNILFFPIEVLLITQLLKYRDTFERLL